MTEMSYEDYEEYDEPMTPEQMQRYIDQSMREGKTYEQALAGLAWILNLHPLGMKRDENEPTS